MSHAGEIDCFCEDSFPAPPLPTAFAEISPGDSRAAMSGGGAIPITFLVPEEARGATAVAKAVAFFAMMDTFVCW